MEDEPVQQKTMNANSLQKWQRLVENCIFQRKGPHDFDALARLLHRDTPVKGFDVARCLLSNPDKVSGYDPLVPLYAESLLILGVIQPGDALQTLLDTRKSQQVEEVTEESVKQATSFIVGRGPLENGLFAALARLYSTSVLAPGPEVPRAVRLLADWMQDLVVENVSGVVQSASASSAAVTQSILSFREHLGALAVAMISNEIVPRFVNGSSCPRDLQSAIAESLSAYMNLITHDFMPIATRLQVLRAENIGLQQVVNKTGSAQAQTQPREPVIEVDVTAVMDAEPMATRAGFLTFLDTLLNGYPALMDTSIIQYVQLRYKVDIAMAITDLITVSFDILAGAVLRRETQERLFLLRSFIVNKVPLLAAAIATLSFVPIEYELLITQALSRLDQTVFPAFSNNFGLDENTNSLAEVRNEFVSSCVLHGILGEASLERILGENSQADTARSVADRQSLVVECRQNTSKLMTLVEGTASMDGNAVARTEALADIFSSTCAARDKATLKTLCNKISRRSSFLDALALYSSLTGLLRPLCRMLVEWKHDEDQQGEYQFVYDEFSGCLLLVLAAANRFKLTAADLSLAEEDSVVRKLVENRLPALLAKNLTPEQDKRFAGWITALFETEAINDELMSTCSPQEFYEMIPLMFSQMIRAVKANALDGETLKNGLGLLLETSLMPALVPGISWIVDQDWSQVGTSNIVVLVLQRVMRPTSIRGEAVNMHSTILSILGRKLSRFLSDMQEREPTRQDLAPLQERLAGCLDFCRTLDATLDELTAWHAPQGGSVMGHLRAHFVNLCYWSSHAEANAATPTFAHRQLRQAVALSGAEAVLNVLLEEIKAQSSAGMADVALDVAAALIFSTVIDRNRLLAAPGANCIPGRLTLNDVLQLELHDAPLVKTKDVFRTETLVRLQRRVLALSSAVPVPAPEQGNVPIALGDDLLNMTGMGELDATAAMDGMGAGAGGGSALGFGDAGAAGAADMQLGIDAGMHDAASGGTAGAAGGPAMVATAGSADEQQRQMAPSTADDDIFGDLVLDEDMSLY